MAVKYTEEQLNSMDKSLLITMFLGLQEQFETLSDKLTTMNNLMQLMMEQLILSKQERSGRSTEKLTDHGQICFMEVYVLPGHKTDDEVDELERLKRENKRLKRQLEEKDMLTELIKDMMNGFIIS